MSSPRFAREATTAVLAPFAIWAVGWSHPYVFDAAIAVVAALALYEFLVLGQCKGYVLPVPLCIAVMLFVVAAFVFEPISVEMGVFVALLVIPASYVLMSGNLDDALPSSAIAVLATLYVGMLAGSMIRLRNDFTVGWKLVYFLLLVVWLGDAGAYYVGRSLGRHKLSPRISPKKTIEGLVGGITMSVITALVIHFTFFKELPLLHAIIAGVILSIAGVIGDLAESMWKRSAAVKDSGTLIPGHGGFLDRFDSIFFTAPILYSYWFLVLHDFRTFKIMSA
ncbi:MAG: phosphatidate cytidylyltransferase [Acidobacteriota bacterium]